MRDKGFQTSRDLVIGLADGAIITFAVVCGLYGAQQNAELIRNAGLVTAIVGAIVFALSRSSTEKTARKEFAAESNSSAGEMAIKLGLGREFEASAKQEMLKDQESFRNQLSDQPVSINSPFSTAFTIGLGFLIGALIVLAAFFWQPIDEDAFKIALIAFGVAMFAAGMIKGRLAGRNIFAGALIQLVTGGAAAGLSFFVGRLLS